MYWKQDEQKGEERKRDSKEVEKRRLKQIIKFVLKNHDIYDSYF